MTKEKTVIHPGAVAELSAEEVTELANSGQPIPGNTYPLPDSLQPKLPKSYDFTLAKNLTRDLRNYHDGVKAQIAEQAESKERDAIIGILNDMNDELKALEKYVGETSAKNELAEAEANLKAAQARVAALKVS